jgi:sporulation protein YlmC with PRC-barrel domain
MYRTMLALPAVIALAWAGGAHAQNQKSQPPQPPKSVAEAPAMGGQPGTKPGPKVINLGSNQASLADLADANLVHVTQQQLGQLSPVLFQQSQDQTAPVPQNIGTVQTALLDPARHTIDFVVVQTGNKQVLVPWSDVRPVAQPHPQIATALSPDAVANAAPLSDQQGHAIDIKTGLIGRTVRSSDNKDLGKLSDVVAQIGTGTVDYIIVTPGGASLGTSNPARAVPWSAIKPPSTNKAEPITLKLDEQEWKSTPVFGGSKAQETQAMRDKARQTGASGPIP